jgi:hypothetical protein
VKHKGEKTMELWQAVIVVIVFSVLLVASGKSLYRRGYSDGKWYEWDKAYQAGFDQAGEAWSMTAEDDCSCDFCLYARYVRNKETV